jgi:manganese oxidase
MRTKSAIFLAGLLVVSVVLAGCFGGGRSGGRNGTNSYEGQFIEYDLYLNDLRSTSDSNGDPSGGWRLYPGRHVDAWAFSLDRQSIAEAQVPGPVIRAREGDTVRINFWSIGTPMAHTIHWHGIHLPWQQDGVPYVSQLPIGQSAFGGVGPSFTYEFKLHQSGTYWYHCHVDTAHHLDMGMYGVFIVDPADPRDDPKYDAEATLVLDEWDASHAHQNVNAITNALSRSGDPGVTANDLYAYIRDYLIMNGVYDDTIAEGPAANTPGLRENRDWYPITYAPYFAEYDAFLINGKAFPDTQPILAKSGEVLRLRIVNAGSQVHALHLHGHHMYVTHKDGFRVPTLAAHDDPYGIDTHEEFQRTTQAMDTILLGPGERYDAYVILDNPGPWMIHDHMPLNEANDYIHPGGMMTMLCYEDGWEKAQDCAAGHLKLHGGGEYTSGDVLASAYNLLRTQYAVQQVKAGNSGGSAILPILGHH